MAGEIALGLETQLSITTATLLKVWDTGPRRWYFATQVSLPYVWNRISATLSVAGFSFGDRETAICSWSGIRAGCPLPSQIRSPVA